jgi:hypothetical protein
MSADQTKGIATCGIPVPANETGECVSAALDRKKHLFLKASKEKQDEWRVYASLMFYFRIWDHGTSSHSKELADFTGTTALVEQWEKNKGQATAAFAEWVKLQRPDDEAIDRIATVMRHSTKS